MPVHCVCHTPAAKSVRIPGMPMLCRDCQMTIRMAYPMVNALFNQGRGANILTEIQKDPHWDHPGTTQSR